MIMLGGNILVYTRKTKRWEKKAILLKQNRVMKGKGNGSLRQAI